MNRYDGIIMEVICREMQAASGGTADVGAESNGC